MVRLQFWRLSGINIKCEQLIWQNTKPLYLLFFYGILVEAAGEIMDSYLMTSNRNGRSLDKVLL